MGDAGGMSLALRQRVCVQQLNIHITCVLCGGYIIDATTITHCLHAFCKSCIVAFLQTSLYCPICDVQLDERQPLLSLSFDETLQNLIYKLVPGLLTSEIRRRKEFAVENSDTSYQQLNLGDSGISGCGGTVGDDSQCGGSLLEDNGRLYREDEQISLSIEYSKHGRPFRRINRRADSSQGGVVEPTPDRFLLCPATFKISHLKKFIYIKYNLQNNMKVVLFRTREPLSDDLSLMDVAYIYKWNRHRPLRLFYTMYRSANTMFDHTTLPSSFRNYPLPTPLHPSLSSHIKEDYTPFSEQSSVTSSRARRHRRGHPSDDDVTPISSHGVTHLRERELEGRGSGGRRGRSRPIENQRRRQRQYEDDDDDNESLRQSQKKIKTEPRDVDVISIEQREYDVPSSERRNVDVMSTEPRDYDITSSDRQCLRDYTIGRREDDVRVNEGERKGVRAWEAVREEEEEEEDGEGLSDISPSLRFSPLRVVRRSAAIAPTRSYHQTQVKNTPHRVYTPITPTSIPSSAPTTHPLTRHISSPGAARSQSPSRTKSTTPSSPSSSRYLSRLRSSLVSLTPDSVYTLRSTTSTTSPPCPPRSRSAVPYQGHLLSPLHASQLLLPSASLNTRSSSQPQQFLSLPVNIPKNFIDELRNLRPSHE